MIRGTNNFTPKIIKEQLDRLGGFENESEAFQIELTKYWTQYEAIMKLIGTGFSGELDDENIMIKFYSKSSIV